MVLPILRPIDPRFSPRDRADGPARVGLPGRTPGSAFTLTELLVTIAIIAALAALLLPVLGGAKEAGRSTACISNLHQIGVALQLYVQDNDHRFPVLHDAPPNSPTNSVPLSNSVATLDRVLSNHVGAVKVFACPSDDRNLFERTGTSFSWNVLLNGQSTEQIEMFQRQYEAHQVPVVFDKEPFHRARGANKGVNYLYADSHIQNLLTLEGGRPTAP